MMVTSSSLVDAFLHCYQITRRDVTKYNILTVKTAAPSGHAVGKRVRIPSGV